MKVPAHVLAAVKQHFSNMSEDDIAQSISSKNDKTITFERLLQLSKEWTIAPEIICEGAYVVAKKEFYHPLRFLDADMQLFIVTKVIGQPRRFSEHFVEMSNKMASIYSNVICDLELMGIDSDGEVITFCYSSKLMRIASKDETDSYAKWLNNKANGDVCPGCGKVHDINDHQSAIEAWDKMIGVEDENVFIAKLVSGDFPAALFASQMAATNARKKFDADNDSVSEMELINRDLSQATPETRNQHTLVIAGMLIDNYNRTVVMMNAEQHARYQRLINYFSKERKD